jgi:hypothetical protein
MKACNRPTPAIAALGAWWWLHIAGPVRAFHYGRAAERDERNGFPYTAAMEWRNAAELFGPNTRAAEYCWRQWERIMHLSRQLAGPISVPPIFAVPVESVCTSPSAMKTPINQISFASAA